MSYGQLPMLREYAQAGDLRWQARFGVDSQVQSYRGFKTEWVGRPRMAPVLVTKEFAIHVSWQPHTHHLSQGMYIRMEVLAFLERLKHSLIHLLLCDITDT